MTLEGAAACPTGLTPAAVLHVILHLWNLVGPSRGMISSRMCSTFPSTGIKNLETILHAHCPLQDPTALALAAEAYLNLCPWDFMDPSTGERRPDAQAADALLLRALRLNPHHELALHLHVHLAEAGAELWSHVEDNPGKKGCGVANAWIPPPTLRLETC